MISGILVINKPAGPTSHDIVDKIRKISNIKQVGHAGTLDPFAEGLLIILIGKATKSQSRFMVMPKTYMATLKLGQVSDTYDTTGIKSEIRSTKSETPKDKPTGQANSKFEIQNVLNSFMGKIKQTPPVYSAIKIKGKKAYELARKGIKPKLKPRKVKVYDVERRTYRWPYLKIKVRCGKGTYIRSLANDIGEKLGCGAYLEKLVRTKIGKFDIDNSVRIDKLNKDNWQKYLICVQ